MEIQCHCMKKHETTVNHHGVFYDGQCEETISYKNHHDWGSEEDYMCETCLDKCLDNECK